MLLFDFCPKYKNYYKLGKNTCFYSKLNIGHGNIAAYLVNFSTSKYSLLSILYSDNVLQLSTHFIFVSSLPFYTAQCSCSIHHFFFVTIFQTKWSYNVHCYTADTVNLSHVYVHRGYFNLLSLFCFFNIINSGLLLFVFLTSSTVVFPSSGGKGMEATHLLLEWLKVCCPPK